MLQQSDSRSTRERILEAAMELFAELPYEQVQMDHVAHRARVAKPTLYRYFAAKEQLFLVALEEFLGDFARAAAAIAHAPGPPDEALASIMTMAFHRFASCTAAIRAVDGSEAGLGVKGRRLARARMDEIRGAIVTVLERGAASGDFEDSEPATTALIILGALRLTAARTPADQRTAALRRIRALLLGGLMPRPDRELHSATPLRAVGEARRSQT